MKKLHLIIVIGLAVLEFSCGGTSKYFTPVSSVRRDPQQQISDSEIQKAFQTKPQLVKPITIALYGGGSSIKGFADSLKKMENVRDVFEISPGLIEGDSYYQRRGYDWFDEFYRPNPINLSQLRLAAAQAKCDLLIYCGVSHKYRETSNYLAYSYILLITAAFVPGQDAELISNADLFCVDVRNGYLYGSYTDQEIYRENFVTLNFDQKLDPIKDNLVQKMVPRLTDYIKELLDREEIYISNTTN